MNDLLQRFEVRTLSATMAAEHVESFARQLRRWLVGVEPQVEIRGQTVLTTVTVDAYDEDHARIRALGAFRRASRRSELHHHGRRGVESYVKVDGMSADHMYVRVGKVWRSRTNEVPA